MDWILFLIFLAACCAAAATGAMFEPGKWYESLNKPCWTPPKWLFPVAWTTLYLFMSYAAMRVGMVEGTARALALWALQIALNTLWTPIFFGLRRMRAALYVIGFLWLSVVATTVAFFQVDFLAGILFLPYVAWVSTAAALNYSVMKRNPDAGAD
ncbi:MAG: tryptophan-rich sensory protein [Rhodobacteraceae bacterium]|nr:tryptophan-rich sensory protein [Paracoccaceae bacterium]